MLFSFSFNILNLFIKIWSKRKNDSNRILYNFNFFKFKNYIKNFEGDNLIKNFYFQGELIYFLFFYFAKKN
jgi:hypothetical protein